MANSFSFVRYCCLVGGTLSLFHSIRTAYWQQYLWQIVRDCCNDM